MIPHQPNGVDTLRLHEVERFPRFEDIDHGQLFVLSLSNNTTMMTHGLHRFPAKYIPQVPSWALDSFGTQTGITLDPFMGSGTTLVEGIVRGGTTIGIDIDPLARLIARAKVTTLNHEHVTELGQRISERWQGPARRLRSPMPDIDNFTHWFSLSQWAWIQSLRDTIMELDCSGDDRDFLLVVFSSTLRWVSNADDQSQKTYVSGTLHKTPPPVDKVFWRFFRRAVDGLAQLNQRRCNDAIAIIPESSNAMALGLEPMSVDLAVSSPPYLDSVDYPYNMMLEYFWVGPHIGVPDRGTFNLLRRRPIGAKNPMERTNLPAPLEGLIDLEVMPPARRIAAASYFALMECHFAEMARCLKVGARYVFVVGNCQSRIDVLPIHDALVYLATSAGFELERAFGYRIRRHYMKFPRNGRGGIILIDWVLVFRKSKAPVREPQPLPLPWVTLAPEAVAH